MAILELPGDLSERIEAAAVLPPLPPLAAKAIQLASGPDIDLVTVAETIGGDPATAAKVRQMANAALHARRRRVANLRQALIVLGLRATLTLALSVTLVASLQKAAPKGFESRDFWRRAILAATWGKLLAGEFGRRDAEEVFLAALLQDIGMLAIDVVAPEVYDGINPFQLDHARVVQHEKTHLQTDHRIIGAALLQAWGMPQHLAQAVLHSHDLTAAGVDSERKEFVRAVALSGYLAEVWVGNRNATAIRKAGLEANTSLGILPNRLAEMFDVIGEQLQVAESIFEMKLFDAAYVQKATDTARAILVGRNVHTITDTGAFAGDCNDSWTDGGRAPVEAGQDGLTGVSNRRFFEASLTREFETAARLDWPLSIVLVELDGLEQVNASHGHFAGDQVLRAVAGLLQAGLRGSDIVARYGGDEFVLLLPGLDADTAARVAARLVAKARGRTVEANGETIQITLSVGTATRDDGNRFDGPADLLAAADQALHHSRHNGRDRHTCFDAIRAA